MIVFEPAREADLPQLVELLGLLFDQEAEFRPDAAKQTPRSKTILADPVRGRIYVARDGRRPVAMASLLYHRQHRGRRQGGVVRGPGGAPGVPAQGTGQKMLEHVIDQARAEGVLRLTLLTDMQNERAQALYRGRVSSVRR